MEYVVLEKKNRLKNRKINRRIRMLLEKRLTFALASFVEI